MIGYFDPAMTEIMQEISRLLRITFGTRNAVTLPCREPDRRGWKRR